ncbi:hypothetical protein BKH46_03375 [Helicobacter sp. 12S02634-8]|nr:hypothetical protein BKH46_03375 [Helicobacter sp. 12S02634-8]
MLSFQKRGLSTPNPSLAPKKLFFSANKEGKLATSLLAKSQRLHFCSLFSVFLHHARASEYSYPSLFVFAFACSGWG